MGIPLAALAINQNQPGPLETVGKALQLKALQQQQQYQAQAQPLELQQRQQAVAEGAYQQAARQAQNKAYQNAVTIDANGQPKFDSAAVTKSLSDSGFGSEAPTILKHMQEFEQGKANLEKTHADTQKLQGEVQTHQQDMMGSMGAAIKAAKNDPAVADTFLQHMELTPGMPPEGKQQIEQFRQQIQQNPAVVGQLADRWIAQSPAQQKLENERMTAEARKASTEISAAHLQAELPGGPLNRLVQDKAIALDPDIQRAKIQVAGAETAARAAATQAQQAKGTPETPLDPKQQATAQAIVDGRMSPPGSFALKTPYWQNIMGEVFKQDPQWNEQRAQLRKSYTVGKQSGEINAINTALGHVGLLDETINALNNKDTRALNAIGNRLGIEFGAAAGDNTAMFKTIVHRVGPEVTKAYLGAGGSQGERGTTEADFSENLAPHILHGNTAITAKLLRSKISSLENQWNQNAPQGQDFQSRFIMPAAKQALEKLAPEKEGGGAKHPEGATHIVPGPDGKKHYTNAAGTIDYGVVP